MAECIEREAILKALENADPDVYEDYGDGTVDWGFGRKNIQDMINGIPAADVVPVVRCENCAFSQSDGWVCSGTALMPQHRTFPNNFCSDGERRDDINKS